MYVLVRVLICMCCGDVCVARALCMYGMYVGFACMCICVCARVARVCMYVR